MGRDAGDADANLLALDKVKEHITAGRAAVARLIDTALHARII